MPKDAPIATTTSGMPLIIASPTASTAWTEIEAEQHQCDLEQLNRQVDAGAEYGRRCSEVRASM